MWKLWIDHPPKSVSNIAILRIRDIRMDDRRVETRIRNRLAEVESVAEIVSQFCATHSLSNQLLVALGVSLDEALSNIIRYAYKDGTDHSIRPLGGSSHESEQNERRRA